MRLRRCFRSDSRGLTPSAMRTASTTSAGSPGGFATRFMNSAFGMQCPYRVHNSRSKASILEPGRSPIPRVLRPRWLDALGCRHPSQSLEVIRDRLVLAGDDVLV